MRVIDTTDAIESVNARLRKVTRTRSDSSGGDAAGKLIWWALRNRAADCGKAAYCWKEAMNQFVSLGAERFTRDA